MSLDELNDICKNGNLYDENFVERDMNIAYNLSIMTQVDELYLAKGSEMQFVEFLEAIARIAEKLSPPPYGVKPVITHKQGELDY